MSAPKEKKVTGRLEKKETRRTNVGGLREKKREKRGEEACAREEEVKTGRKKKRRGRRCGPVVGLHPNKPLVTWHLCHVTNRVTWHMCHLTIGLINK
jgi:hypothetical protein